MDNNLDKDKQLKKDKEYVNNIIFLEKIWLLDIESEATKTPTDIVDRSENNSVAQANYENQKKRFFLEQ